MAYIVLYNSYTHLIVINVTMLYKVSLLPGQHAIVTDDDFPFGPGISEPIRSSPIVIPPNFW